MEDVEASFSVFEGAANFLINARGVKASAPVRAARDRSRE